MLLSAIGLGMKAVGGIVGGILQRKQTRKIEQSLDQQRADLDQLHNDQQAWYDRTYNEDATQRADAQRLLTLSEESYKAANRRAAGAAAVGGATEESVAAAKAASTQAMADTRSQIAAAAANRKDAIDQQHMQNEQQYLTGKQQIENERNKLYQQKAAATGQAVQGVLDAAGNLITA